jgi:hypothetical protein
LLSGLWHGASWTFVIWGALHGLFVVIDAGLRGRGLRVTAPVWVKLAVTYALVSFAWIFFRANSLDDAVYIAGNLLTFTPTDLTAPFALAEGVLLTPGLEFVLAWVLIGLLLAVDALDARVGLDKALSVSPVGLRWAVYYAAGTAVLVSGLYGVGAQQFIYFQF